ncbi:helix-turn-helix domain-containing protein [Bombella apis]|uniref:helix-turn-helix domain-containing protein n=1 Tax=Bombella apis TaxID=1785988 RepID=UPI0024A92E55|nr:helix-turn-helix transcriptional regulator [Bombella apis]
MKNSINPVEIGQRLKALRLKFNLNQAETVAALDVEIQCSQLSKIEHGKSLPSFKVLCALADLYNVSIDYLRSGGEPVSNMDPSGSFTENATEIALIQAFRAMNIAEREAIVRLIDTFGRDRGLDKNAA